MRIFKLIAVVCFGVAAMGTPGVISALEVIPTIRNVPAMRGDFVEEEWAKDSLKLTDFTMIPGPAGPKVFLPANEKTTIYLKKDKKFLYLALILFNEDVPSLVKKQESDRKKHSWQLPGIEIILGEESFIQLALDYTGKYYKNNETIYFTNTLHKRDRIIYRVGIPMKDIPRCAVSPELFRFAAYRKSKSGVSSAFPAARSNFKDLSLGRPLLLQSGNELADSMEKAVRNRIDTLFQASSLMEKDRKTLLEALAAKKKQLLAAGKDEKALLAALKDFNTIEGAISKAQEVCLRADLGIRKKGNVFSTPSTRIPELWRPQKIHGKDFWYTFTAFNSSISRMEKFGLMKDPLFHEAMFFLRWGKNFRDFLEVESEIGRLLARYPDTPFAIKTPCPRFLNEESRKKPEFNAFWDKKFMDGFYARFKHRFYGFWSDECFVSGNNQFPETMDYYKDPRPKTREGAYKLFRKYYFTKTKSAPHAVPFRNLANMSEYTCKDAMNCAAVQLNHMVHAFGDRMSGNETGDVMGPMAPKLSFARGAARQYSRPWRNYNTYYGWYFLNQLSGGGRNSTVGGTLWGDMVEKCLHDGCRWRAYGHLDGPLCGITPDRQKPFILYPYLAGATVWYSEADLNELVAPYKTGVEVDPLVRNLRENKLYHSAITKIHSHFYNRIVKKRDRGVMLTPVALVYDRAHGYLPLYFGDLVWDLFPPTEMERVMWAIERHLYRPYSQNPSYTHCAYGDIFDVLTNDASGKILDTYKVLYLVGDVTLDKPFVAKLKDYVKNGGTLIINAALIRKYAGSMAPGFPGVKLNGKTNRTNAFYSRITGKVIMEDFPCSYLEMIPAPGTEILVHTADTVRKPVVTRKRYGKGTVIVTGPMHMKVDKSAHKMLHLFDHLMAEIRRESIPISVETDMQYAFCRNTRGYILYMQNNEKMPPSGGITYGKAYPRDYLKVRSDARITFSDSLGGVKEVIDWWTGEKVPFRKVKGGITLKTTIRGGDCQILEFVTGK